MKILDWSTLFNAKFWIGNGCQFLRDPMAMEAIARRQTPKCKACGQYGVFLDGMLRVVQPGANVLDLKDFDAWGIFVFFECQCCNSGWWYVCLAP